MQRGQQIVLHEEDESSAGRESGRRLRRHDPQQCGGAEIVRGESLAFDREVSVRVGVSASGPVSVFGGADAADPTVVDATIRASALQPVVVRRSVTPL